MGLCFGQPIIADISQILRTLDVRFVDHILQPNDRLQVLDHFALLVRNDFEEGVRLRDDARIEDVPNAVTQIGNVFVLLEQILVAFAVGEVGFVAVAKGFQGFVGILHGIVKAILQIDHIVLQLLCLVHLIVQHGRCVRPLIVQFGSAFVRHENTAVMMADFADTFQQQSGLFHCDRQIHVMVARAKSIDRIDSLLNIILQSLDFGEELGGIFTNRFRLVLPFSQFIWDFLNPFFRTRRL